MCNYFLWLHLMNLTPSVVSPDLFAEIDEYNITDLQQLVSRLEMPMKRKQVNVCHDLVAGTKSVTQALKDSGYSISNTTTVVRRLLSNVMFCDLYVAARRLAQIEHGVSAGVTRAVLLEIMNSKTAKNADRINASKEVNRMEGHGEAKAGNGSVTIVFNHPVAALYGDTLSAEKKSGDESTVIEHE